MSTFGIKRIGGSFQKVVWDNCTETYPGGINLDASTLSEVDFPEGIIPEGVPVYKDNTTGLGTIVKPTEDEGDVLLESKPIGYTNMTANYVAGENILVGVGIAGTIRSAALPDYVQDNLVLYKEALPKITHI